MNITLVGLGGGGAGLLTEQAHDRLRRAQVIVGAQRLLDALPEYCTAQRIAAVRYAEILAVLQQHRDKPCCAIYSGDTGFYSGARGLLELLRREGMEAEILPGISSVQLMAAKLGRPWQAWKLVSAHGVACDPVPEVMDDKPVLFLTGTGEQSPAALCRRLTQAGLGALEVTVGENLSYDDERITTGTASELAAQDFAVLSVLLAEPAPETERISSGIADERFIRGSVPMTKQEVRAAALGKLAIRPNDTVWDVGAGTGSVSVELALAAARGRVYAIECSPEGCELIETNRADFGAWNLTVIEGNAPEALADLPTPDAVFIGGSKGQLDGILDVILDKNPRARLCISAIAVETLGKAVSALTARGLTAQVTQIAVSRSRAAGSLHLMMANNPVFLITGERDD